MTISITIRQNSFGEYEVPTERTARGKAAAIYYTDDREDARDTARYAAGVFDGEPEPCIRWIRGTYNVEEA